MKFCKKLSIKKLESQNEKMYGTNHGLLCDDYCSNATTITALLNSESSSNVNCIRKNFAKCKISGRDNCFWCTRSLLKMNDCESVINFKIVDPDEFFENNFDFENNDGNNNNNEHNSKDNNSEIVTSVINNIEEEEEHMSESIEELTSDWEVIQTPTDQNQNFFSSEFEDEIVAAMSSSSAGISYYDLYETNDCQMLRITFCELLFCQIRIISGIPEKPSPLPTTVFDSTSPSGTSSSPKICKVKKTVKERSNNNKLKLPRTSAEEKKYRKTSKADAFSRSLMGAIAKCQDCDSSDSDDKNDNNDNNRITTITQHNCDPFDIQEYFKLDDHGNILIDISHIVEEKGHGFLMRRTKRLYRSVKSGIAINESYTVKKCMMERLQEFIQALKEILFGHPRNKTHSGGPGESVRAYTLQLASDHTSTFSRNIENFICCTKESREAAPQVVMRNMRQFMNGMKNYLVKHGEGDFHQEVQKARSRLKSDEFLNLDAILEGVMHQLVVLPLREHLYGMFVDYYTRSGDIQLLVENVKYACARNPIDFGIRPSVAPPTSIQLNQISTLLVRLQEAELPLDKLDLFLCVIAAVFEATGCPRGQQLGADDFLPILVFVVAKCGFIGAEIEAEFMWGLLQPALLSGEAGYYLTALCSAVHVLKSFMSSENEGTGSLDWRSSSLPACSSVLRVIIPDECNGSLQTRTLPVRPHTTTREVCRIIAHKARITNPQDYGLFKLVDGEETILAESECPQDARIAARGKHCILAYKRIDAKIAWPTATQPSFT